MKLLMEFELLQQIVEWLGVAKGNNALFEGWWSALAGTTDSGSVGERGATAEARVEIARQVTAASRAKIVAIFAGLTTEHTARRIDTHSATY